MKKVAILGSGPAGLLCAAQLKGKADVSVIEIGKPLTTRVSKTEGLGGGGAFSDGKFNLDPCIGGRLSELIGYRETKDVISSQVDRFFIKHGAPENQIKEGEYSPEFKALCRSAGFKVKESATRHWGTDKGPLIIQNIFDGLKNDVEFQFENELSSENIKTIIQSDIYDFVVLSVGRSGMFVLDSLYREDSLPFFPGATDVGIRYECCDDIFETFYQTSYEPKLLLRDSFDETVRLFCACLKDGYVTMEDYPHLNNLQCVNGHSKTQGDTGNANFAILVTVEFTHPFHEPNAYCRSICDTCNALAGGGVLVQAHADFIRKRRSTAKRIKETGIIPSLEAAIPGDISFAIPYRQMSGIVEFIEHLEKVFPGVSNGLMYAPEVKFYASRADIDYENLHYKGSPNIYPAGDCSGWTRSLAQAAAHGWLVGQKIAEKL